MKNIISSVESENFENVEIFYLNGKEDLNREFNKGVKIKWLEELKQGRYNNGILPIFYIRGIISDINKYVDFINPYIFDIYKKDETYQYAMKLGKKNDINTKDLFSSMLELLDVVEEFSKENNIKIDTNNSQ
jgi:hypothetical protein